MFALVAAAAAFASWGATAALTGAVILGATITATAASLIGAVVGLVVSAAGAMLLASTVKRPSLPDYAQDRKLAVRSGIEPRRVVYGRSLVSGPPVYMGSSGSQKEYVHVVLVVAGHPIDGFEEVWINNQRIVLNAAGVGGMDGLDRAGGAFGGTVRIHTFDGTQVAASGALQTDIPSDWTADHKLLGLAYIYVRILFSREHFEQFDTISAVVRGKKVYDPRDASTAWSPNAALCILDYLTSTDGIGADLAEEVEETYWEAAANICDEPVALTSGGSVTEPRYELHGSFKLDQTPIDIVRDLLSSCGGALTYVNGRYRLHVAAYESPAVTLTQTDLAGDIRVIPTPPRRSVINRIHGTYIDPAQKWVGVAFPPVEVSTFEAEDGEVIIHDAPFPFCTSRTQVQRLARIALLRARRGLTVEVPLKLTGHQITAWSTFGLTMPDFSWTNKAFRVLSWRYDPASKIITITAQEEQSSSYTWLYSDAGPDLSTDTPTLASPLDIAAPASLTLSATTDIQDDGSTVPALLVTWVSPANPFVTATEVQWRRNGTTPWSAVEVPMPGNRVVLAPLLSNVDYDVRVRAKGGLRLSAWTSTATDTVEPDTTAPGLPTSISATGTSTGISIAWTKPADNDFQAVEVWENTSSSTTGRYYVGESSGGGFLRSGLGGGVQRWYWLRSRDRTGNLSAFTSSVNATSSTVGTADITQWAASGWKSTAANNTVGFDDIDFTTVLSASITVPDGGAVVIHVHMDVGFVALPGDSGDGVSGEGGDAGGGDS